MTDPKIKRKIKAIELHLEAEVLTLNDTIDEGLHWGRLEPTRVKLSTIRKLAKQLAGLLNAGDVDSV